MKENIPKEAFYAWAARILIETEKVTFVALLQKFSTETKGGPRKSGIEKRKLCGKRSQSSCFSVLFHGKALAFHGKGDPTSPF